ncbi:arsenical-resistance protein [Candidatus Izimaplasma bacterium ZiA1]|uniref:ACR3 family arsenite efflux transporter n=1 Tax=Candidatus Izimoplasma sp. ZiA1 TaxID=2024899 RepID=UPI000BAA504E|nr:arsenical-resistance protein [Candidatus Izimaplasma bacterium ZiA1]
MEKSGISFFSKYLTVWVILCMGVGILISEYFGFIPDTLSKYEYNKVSLPIAILIWFMIYPMMMKVDFISIKKVKDNPKGLYLTWIINWLVKPFTMYLIASLFFFVIFKSFIPSELGSDYLIGAVLLGAAPCTAMVFVWSHLTNGNPAYTVVQVATNDIIILFAFVPIVKLLLGLSNIFIPWDTLFLSVIVFVVIPLFFGVITRIMVVKKKGLDYFENTFLSYFDNFTIIGLLLTLALIFSFQGSAIINNPFNILLISVPLIIQTFLIFFITYFIARRIRLKHEIASPSGMIGASNFFELSVAVAISIFGPTSPVTLVTIVGVLVEVPVMLSLVKFANKTKHWFNN